MARYFAGSTNRLCVSNSVVSTDNFYTFACWFNPVNITACHTLMALSDYSTNHYAVLCARGDKASDPLWAHTFTRTSSYAVTSTGFVANTWQHGCAVFAAADDRRVYLNGGGKGTQGTNQDFTAQDNFCIGRAHVAAGGPGSAIEGSIAEAAIWNGVLTDAEIAVLATGIRPILVRPESLALYLPLIRDNDKDLIGGLSFTVTGTASISDHAPIIYGAL